MKTTHDSHNSGFIIAQGSQRFSVDYKKVSPESFLATSRLLQQIVRYRHLAKGVMLDVGCGTKPYAVLFHDQVSSHVGIDVPYSDHSHSEIDVYSTATKLPFRNESFDFVLCTEVLEHVDDPFSAYREISRVLKPGGRALLTTPFMYRVHEAPYDFFRYTPFAHASLAEKNGLAIEAIAQRGGYFTVLADYLIKGLMLAFSTVGFLLYKATGHGRRIALSAPVRWIMFAIQLILVALLKNERVKADTYTLGYVLILVKSATEVNGLDNE